MKRLLILITFALCLSTLQAQRATYLVIGFAGKDTIHLGRTTISDDGVLSIYLGDYRGAIHLQYLDPQHEDIVRNLVSAQNIRSLMAFEAAKAYVADELPFDVLHRSGLWQEYIQQWVGFYANTMNNQQAFAEAFLPVVKRVIDRTIGSSPETVTFLALDLISFFEQFGMDRAAEEIAIYVNQFGITNSRIERLVLSAQLRQGTKAPPLTGLPAETLQGRTSILFFHTSDCGHCERQLNILKARYAELSAKGIQIISIYIDEDEESFNNITASMPWEHRLKPGDNFINYGVFSAPVFVVINDGIIQGRHATLDVVLRDYLGQ